MPKPVLLKTAALAAALALPLAAAAPALAATVTVEVDATAHSSNLGTGLATGVFVRPGFTLSVMTDPRNQTWSLGADEPERNCTRTTTADGLAPDCYGEYTQGNLTARYGTLVGRIGSGDFFVLGTLFNGVVQQAGQVYLYNWDSAEGDNSGAIRVAVSAVPLPAGGLLLLGAMGGLAALRRRRG